MLFCMCMGKLYRYVYLHVHILTVVHVHWPDTFYDNETAKICMCTKTDTQIYFPV